MYKKVFPFLLIIFFIFSFIFYSCSNPVNVDPILNEITNPPIITGIIVTNNDGPTPIKIIGVPNENPSLSSTGMQKGLGDIHKLITFKMEPLYPNPAPDYISITFSLAQESKVSVWVVAGHGSDEILNMQYFNSYCKSSSVRYALELVYGNLSAGVHMVNWDFNSYRSPRPPDGLYRVYVEVNGKLMWRNLWIKHDNSKK